MTSDIVTTLFSSDLTPTGAAIEFRLEAFDGRPAALIVAKIRPGLSDICVRIPFRHIDALASALEAWRSAIAAERAEDAERTPMHPTRQRPFERPNARLRSSSRSGGGR